jgi:hypothetical protein
MTDTSSDVSSSVPRQTAPVAPQPSGWVGWIGFAAVLMFILGAFHAIQGLVALFRDEYYVVSESGLVVDIDYTAWGWTHLILGILVCAAGLGLLVGKTWARVVAVLVAVVSVFVNLGFLSAYPVWSTMMIAMDVLVIWAVIVHGDEMRSVEVR